MSGEKWPKPQKSSEIQDVVDQQVDTSEDFRMGTSNDSAETPVIESEDHAITPKGRNTHRVWAEFLDKKIRAIESSLGLALRLLISVAERFKSGLGMSKRPSTNSPQPEIEQTQDLGLANEKDSPLAIGPAGDSGKESAKDERDTDDSAPQLQVSDHGVVLTHEVEEIKSANTINIQKLVPIGLWGIILIGLALTLYGLTSFSGEEQEQANQQQAQAETVPLVVPVQTPTEMGVESKVPEGQVFAKLYVPRFGKTYVREIAEGTGMDSVLNKIGIGKYTSSEMPGEVGNFALAAHRTGAGGPFRDIDKLQDGDLVFVETAAAWYTYRYLDTIVIEPEQIEVIADTPGLLEGAVRGGKYLTLTSCTPIYVNTQRIAVWFELLEQQPASMGMPEALKQVRG